MLAAVPATPALVLDGPTVERNVCRLADYTAAHGLALRPHTKTHKSLRLAKLQLAAGAAGLTVAKVGEAELMAAASDDLLLAYPALDPARTERLAALAAKIGPSPADAAPAAAGLRVAVDSAQAVDALALAACRAGSTIGILVDLDVGLGRTGVQSPAEALALAQHVSRCVGVRLDGLFCYPGHIWGTPDEQGAALAKVSAALAETLELWRKSGLPCRIVSGGSTPTAYQSHLVRELTEIRPGTYIFNDLNTVRGGYCTLDDCAARIVATVVSTAVPGQVVIDAGSKTLTSDRCVPAPDSGHGQLVEFPDARIVRLSEEHGQVDVRACASPPKLGQRVTVVPNHICPCINLQDQVWWHAAGGLEPLAIDARGRLS